MIFRVQITKKGVPLTLNDYVGDLIVVFIDKYYIMSDYAGDLIVVWAVCAFFHRRKLLVVPDLYMNILDE